MRIRPATDHDLDEILAIHNDAILSSTAIWTDKPVGREEREAWLAERTASGYPVIVADIDGTVAGYASYGPWREKWGYRHSVENSVYVADGHRGEGIGRKLMVELIAFAKTSDAHVMVAGIEASNAPSIRLHESLGFESAGTVREVGTKFGRWLDLAILQLRL